ncbi:hypothetical protein BDZ91DRAFT_321466 [Kalaharituber pfeilii]|nr:hypothetical protein BDZ91DRAFT_321466 [Kalaharituber pfeilii]
MLTCRSHILLVASHCDTTQGVHISFLLGTSSYQQARHRHTPLFFLPTYHIHHSFSYFSYFIVSFFFFFFFFFFPFSIFPPSSQPTTHLNPSWIFLFLFLFLFSPSPFYFLFLFFFFFFGGVPGNGFGFGILLYFFAAGIFFLENIFRSSQLGQ